MVSKVQYLDTFFPPSSQELEISINYTEEDLNTMKPYKKTDKLSRLISTFGGKIVIETCSGIGGNTLGFLRNSSIEKVLTYEVDKGRYRRLTNNVNLYGFKNRAFCYNQEFIFEEDLMMTSVPDLDEKKLLYRTVVFFDPPWLLPSTTSKENYLKEGIVLSGKTLEDWAKTLNVLAVIFHLPPGYNFKLQDIIVDDKTDSKARLIYYSKYNEVRNALSSKRRVKTVDDSQVLHTYLSPEFPRKTIPLETKPSLRLLDKGYLYRGQFLMIMEFLSKHPTRLNRTKLLGSPAPVQFIESLKRKFDKLQLVDSDENLYICLHNDFVTCLENYNKTPGLLLLNLPIGVGDVTLLKGNLLLAPYSAGDRSYAVYLEVSSNPPSTSYSLQEYHEQLTYFIENYAPSTFNGVYGWSFDTIREYYIIKNYLKNEKLNDDDQSIIKISKELDKLFPSGSIEKLLKYV